MKKKKSKKSSEGCTFQILKWLCIDEKNSLLSFIQTNLKKNYFVKEQTIQKLELLATISR